MKRFLVFLVSLVELVVSAKAQHIVETANYQVNTQIAPREVSVLVSKKKGERVMVVFQNEQGTIIKSRKMARLQTHLRFYVNMYKLANGTYYLHVKDENTLLTQVVRKPAVQFLDIPVPNELIVQHR